jgi:hypothetical protein
MIEKKTTLLTLTLILFIFYHYYDSCTDNNIDILKNNLSETTLSKNSEITLSENSESSSESNKNNNLFEEKTLKKLNNNLEKKLNNNLVKKIKKMKKTYGEPSEIKKINGSSVYIWDFLDNGPWNKIIYDYNNDFSYYYYIKARINNLDEYQKWKKLLPNLDFDPKRKSLILQTKDETTALAVANIILSNLQGKIGLDEIIKKQLIPISINRAKKYDMVKKKLKEQLIETINGSKNKGKGKEKILDYSEDLANPENNKKEIIKKEIIKGPIAGNELYSIPTKNESPLAAMQVSADTGFSFI